MEGSDSSQTVAKERPTLIFGLIYEDHFSYWAFPLLLLALASTGLGVHLFRNLRRRVPGLVFAAVGVLLPLALFLYIGLGTSFFPKLLASELPCPWCLSLILWTTLQLFGATAALLLLIYSSERPKKPEQVPQPNTHIPEMLHFNTRLSGVRAPSPPPSQVVKKASPDAVSFTDRMAQILENNRPPTPGRNSRWPREGSCQPTEGDLSGPNSGRSPAFTPIHTNRELREEAPRASRVSRMDSGSQPTARTDYRWSATEQAAGVKCAGNPQHTARSPGRLQAPTLPPLGTPSAPSGAQPGQAAAAPRSTTPPPRWTGQQPEDFLHEHDAQRRRMSSLHSQDAALRQTAACRGSRQDDFIPRVA